MDFIKSLEKYSLSGGYLAVDKAAGVLIHVRDPELASPVDEVISFISDQIWDENQIFSARIQNMAFQAISDLEGSNVSQRTSEVAKRVGFSEERSEVHYSASEEVQAKATQVKGSFESETHRPARKRPLPADWPSAFRELRQNSTELTVQKLVHTTINAFLASQSREIRARFGINQCNYVDDLLCDVIGELNPENVSYAAFVEKVIERLEAKLPLNTEGEHATGQDALREAYELIQQDPKLRLLNEGVVEWDRESFLEFSRGKIFSNPEAFKMRYPSEGRLVADYLNGKWKDGENRYLREEKLGRLELAVFRQFLERTTSDPNTKALFDQVLTPEAMTPDIITDRLNEQGLLAPDTAGAREILKTQRLAVHRNAKGRYIVRFKDMEGQVCVAQLEPKEFVQLFRRDEERDAKLVQHFSQTLPHLSW